MTNKLIIGLADKTAELNTKPGFLLIDDGPIADAFLTRFKRAKQFDPHSHSFNPLPMTYRKAREFASIVYGDEGRDALTARNGKRALTRLLMSADRLDSVRGGRGDDDKEATAIIEDLLLSPVLHDVFCKPTNFSFRQGNPPSSIVAKLDRAEIGEHDARILGAVLISQFKGQIIVPDFGFYARDFHTSLIRENRLIAGVHTLAELDSTLRQMCLLMEKVGSQCTYDDAEVLAKYAGLQPKTVAYIDFVDAAMSFPPED
jgi:hypothetical protein